MKPARFQYLAPTSVEEVVDALQAFGDDAKLLAGGQSLGPLLNLRLSTPTVIVDLGRIDELSGQPTGESSVLRVPAMARQRSVEISARARECVPLLTQALPFVAHRTIRNRGTMGGSLAHADPAAELPAVAVAADASMVTQGSAGQRRLPAESFFTGFFTTALRPDEVLVAVEYPMRGEREGTSWLEFAPRRGDFAVVGIAAKVRLSADGSIADGRLVYSGVADRPWHDDGCDSGMVGRPPSPDLFDALAHDAATRCRPISDASGSADYRRSLLRHLTVQALDRACRHAVEGR